MCIHVHTVYIVEMDLELWEDWDVGFYSNPFLIHIFQISSS